MDMRMLGPNMETPAEFRAEHSAVPAWWDGYFDEDFVRLYEPFLPPDRTAREVMGIIEALELESGARVLDIACGWGRHAVELARVGFSVCGLDRSATLLDHARRAAERTGVEVGWVRGDLRELPWSAHFDAAICMFSSLGYFLSDAEDLRALRAARAALRPGGRLLIETMHRDAVARSFAERDWWNGPDGEQVWVEREFDAVRGVVREWLRWRSVNGATGEKYHALRIRSATEWGRLLRRAALVPVGWYGDWDQEGFGHEAERLIIVARPAG